MSVHNADGRQRRCDEDPEGGTAEARPWREEGFSKKYPWLVARARLRIAEEIVERKRTGRGINKPIRVTNPFRAVMDLYALATSYPFLKKAVDITHLRGNTPGPDGETYYLLFQTPDWGDRTLARLRGALRSGRYRPGPLRALRIWTGEKERLLHIPNLIDRVVERAVALVLSAIFEMLFHPRSFGFRTGVALADAFRELDGVLRSSGRRVLGKMDLKNAFDRVPHERLLQVLAVYVGDQRLLELVRGIVCRPAWVNQQGNARIGLPQGGGLSPLLYNVYLDHFLDQVLARRYPGIVFLRWADDILLVCESEAQLAEHRAVVEKLLTGAGLPVNREKTYGPDSKADMKNGECMEYLGLMVGWDEQEGLSLSIPKEAEWRLFNQLMLDVAGQRPNVGSTGYRRFLGDQILYTILSWQQAYAGGIQLSDWPAIRKGIRRLFLEDHPWGDHIPVDVPPKHALDAGYERARGLWDRRMHAPLAGPLQRISPFTSSQRDATATNRVWRPMPDFIADGADITPAPLAFVEPYGERKPGPEVVDWRVQLAPF